MMERDLYKLLGLGATASAEEIKKSFRRLARRYHPDRTKGDKRAEEKFKEISQAYEILGDEKKRKEYDALRRGGFGGGQYFGGPFGGGGPFPGAGGAPKSGGRGGSFETFTDGGGFSSILESLLGGGGLKGRFRGEPQAPPQPAAQDITASLDIPFEMAVRGGKQKITVRMTEPDARGIPRETTKDVSVKIPPGIGDGQKIRLSGAGEAGLGSGQAGSLLITIHVLPHPIFTREGPDIHSKVQIDLATSMLGGTASIQTLDKAVTLRIPPGTQPSQTFKLRGQGGPTRDGARGDHYATIEVRLPKDLTERQRVLFEEFAKSLK
ncbi:MAG: J domain-containing protein [Candidatus Sumerlaeota bacterium]|nr:J domain-containing protein [Candidatus Sumerlaeota bacterium]